MLINSETKQWLLKMLIYSEVKQMNVFELVTELFFQQICSNSMNHSGAKHH